MIPGHQAGTEPIPFHFLFESSVWETLRQDLTRASGHHHGLHGNHKPLSALILFLGEVYCNEVFGQLTLRAPDSNCSVMGRARDVEAQDGPQKDGGNDNWQNRWSRRGRVKSWLGFLD